MLIRISLIVAIIAGLAVGALSFTKIKDTITTTRAERDNERSMKEQAQRDLSKTKSDLSKTTAELAETKQNLESAVAAKTKAETEAAEKIKLAAQLEENLKNTQNQLSAAQAELAAYRGTGLTPEQALAAAKTIKDLESRLEEIRLVKAKVDRELKKAENELAGYRDPHYKVLLPSALSGKVVVSDPKWDFVILNVGEDQGVLQNGELLVNRDGQLVAKVKVTTVEKGRCIANVMPGWKLGEVMEGDLVFPAYPQS